MNQSEFIPVYPNITRSIKICQFKYQILDVQLFKSIRIAIYLYNENNILIESTQLLIEGEDYNRWAQDDTYITNLIKSKIQSLK